jgi:acetyl-CoA carboxylase biotin carboxyl carrier protein
MNPPSAAASTMMTTTIRVRGTLRPGRRRVTSRLVHELMNTLRFSIAGVYRNLSGARSQPQRRRRLRKLEVFCVPHPSSRRSLHLPEVDAHITGTVWKIEVEVGERVQEGDTVVILESMKMEMPVEAEDPGVVKEILCQEGQSVSEGDPLVVLE